MSSFQRLKESDYLNQAEVLHTSGGTCDTYVTTINGRRQFMKILKKEFASDNKYTALFRKEFETGISLSHPNLVKYNNLENTGEGMIMFQDYIAGDLLSARLADNPDYFLKTGNLRKMLLQLLSCLKYLHSRQIVHLDIKPDNLMFSQVDNTLKVLDLGFCYTDNYNNLVGRTEGFDAPEQSAADTGGISAQTDLYAVGRILEHISAKAFIPAGKKLPRAYRELMGRCLQADKNLRPSDADECIAILNRTSVRWWHACAAAVAVVAVLAAVKHNDPGYDMSDRSGNLYRILSEKDMTCEVVGYSKVYDVDGPNIVIEDRASHKDKTYKVVSIADDAFIHDTTVLSVYIPEGIVRIGDRALSRCKNIISLTIPSSVREIGEDCFSKDSLLASIRLPQGLSELRNNCFVDCHALEGIVVPEGVTSIGKDCFTSCTSLQDVALPSSLLSLGRGVFYNCSSLAELTLPESLHSIGDYAFYRCDSLRDIYNLAAVPQEIALIFDRDDITVHVPEQSLALYQNAPGWKNLTIVPIETIFE